jgi:D-threo-aldose 1-dehydrogenase
MTEGGNIERVRLGRTNVEVPNICFGSGPLGDLPNSYRYSVGMERALETVRAIFAGPAPFIDTARNYGFGRSEERIGKVVRELGGLPESAIISTKLDRELETDRFDAAQVRRSLEESLEALGIDRVQLLHLHDPEYAASLDEVTGADGALRELFKMKEEGLADAVGLAAGRVDVMMPILREWDFDALICHNRFMLTNRNAEEMMDFAAGKGITFLNAAPYAGGTLAKGSEACDIYVYQDATEEVLEPIRRIEAICARHGIPLGAAALQFSMRDARVGSTICGISKPERVTETLEWAAWPIAAEVWDELLALPFATDDPEAARVQVLG